MHATLRTVRLVQIAFLVSVVLYVLVGERLGRSFPASLALYYSMSFLSISVVGVIFVVRRTFLSQSEAQLSARPDDNALLARWRVGYIIIYALCESLALFALVLRVMGFQLSQTWTLYLSSFALLLLFGPRQPKAEFGS